MGKRMWWGGAAALVAVAVGGAALNWERLQTLAGARPAGTVAAKPADKAKDSKAGKDGKDGKGDKPAVPLEFSPAEVVQPALASMSTQIEFSGPLVAPSSAVVRAKAGGTLLALTVSEGSRVAAGQAIGRIDQAEMGSRMAERSAAVESARASVESARAALAQAERTHASNERLAQQNFISTIALDQSRAQLDAARAQADTARAQLHQMQASLETTRVGLRDATLVAPIAGIVSKRHVVAGEKVSPEQPVATIVDLKRLELAGAVGTHEVGRLAAGLPVRVAIEGVDQPVAGRLARIAPAAEAGTRSIGVTVELDNPREQLRAGQYGLATVTLADDQRRLTLPVAAVGSTAGQDHVWVITDGLLQRRAVTLGRRDSREGRVEVLNGVDGRAVVLAARFDNLREGAK
ncbi:MAG: efflux RND transporter periplasmic adaptor subunit, partial [Aquabacterium sp.]